ncbi:hypothetical protein [Flexithrix dorotheae]|uniref:hypothetical protein n=1 Tax=Flexithrix dorotheae TaxID=70993 RepID=UPI000369B640|nr:hypothetical protein [Flexithrix dorotheae]
MRHLITFYFFIFMACNTTKYELANTENIEQNPIGNEELNELFIEDQLDRETNDIDWNVVSFRDSLREKRLFELLETNKIYTAKDYRNAAIIFSHGKDTLSSKMAILMMQKAIKLDPTMNKSILAKAIDKDLMKRDKPQIYGTQKILDGQNNWKLYMIDTTQVTDEDRQNYDLKSLDEIRKEIKKLNANQN